MGARETPIKMAYLRALQGSRWVPGLYMTYTTSYYNLQEHMGGLLGCFRGLTDMWSTRGQRVVNAWSTTWSMSTPCASASLKRFPLFDTSPGGELLVSG
eukprot:gene4217-2279_t